MLLTAFLFAHVFSLKGQTGYLDSIDGTFSIGERNSSFLLHETEDIKLYADTTHAGFLRISVESDTALVVSLCIAGEDGLLSVFHASAALGSLIYNKQVDMYRTKENFQWSMRETGMDKEIVGKRSAYLAEHGWIANTMAMGRPGEAEFIIENELITSEHIYIAAGLMPANDPSRIFAIPEQGAEECADYSLVSGSPERTYSFKPIQWIAMPGRK